MAEYKKMKITSLAQRSESQGRLTSLLNLNVLSSIRNEL
jgi:hypothetical protein